MALLLLCAASARAYDFSSGGLYYNIITSTDSVMVTEASGTTYSGDIVIPETVTYNNTTYIVKGVEDYAFQGSSITSVDLSNVSTIGEYSFSCCDLLDSVTIGSKITEIPEGAFYGTASTSAAVRGANMISNLTIPSQITSIGDYAFYYPKNLQKLEFEENSQCTRIGVRAFSNDVTSFNANMSYGNLHYEELDIPASVKFIGDYCFYCDENLKKVTLHEGLDSIGAYAFAGDYDKTYSFDQETQIEEITIPSTVTYIGDYAFQYSPDLKTVTYNAAAVKNKDSYAFGKGEQTVTKLVIGPKVREIPDKVLYRVTDTSGDLEIEWDAERCEYLGKNCLDKAAPVTLTIGEDVKELCTTTDSDGNELEEPAGLFVSIDSPGTGLGLTSLTTLNYNAPDCPIAGTLDAIPFTITKSNYNDNKDDSKNILPAFPLETVNFGDSVKTIPAHLFNGSSTYEKSSDDIYPNEFQDLTTINLPASVETIGDYAFNDCTALTSITFNGSNLKTIGNHAFANCHNESLTSISLPSSLETIGNNAFDSCLYVAQIEIPAAVTCIGDSAFRYCTSAESITFDGATDQTSALQTIGDYAFAECNNEGVTAITIPDEVTKVGNNAFYDCTAVKEVAFNAKNCTYGGAVDEPAFNKCSALNKVTVAAGVTNIPSYLFCGSAESAPTGITTVDFKATDCSAATGDIEYPPFRGHTGLNDVTIESGVTKVPDFLFDAKGTDGGFSSFTGVSIPSSVTSIGDSAFYCCEGLGTITFNGTNLKTIGSHAFAVCDNSNLTTITLPSSVETIGENAFDSCKYVTPLIIPANVKTMGGNAFANWSALETLTYNATSCTTAGTESAPVFANCPAVSSVTIDDNVTTLPAYLFAAAPEEENHFTNFDEVTIPSAITSIGAKAFYGCPDLTTITALATTPATCGENAFSSIHSNSWLVVPEDYAEAYGTGHRATVATQTGWSDITHMREDKVTIDMTNNEGYVSRFSPYSYTLDDDMTGATVTNIGEKTETTTQKTVTETDENGNETTETVDVVTITYSLQTSAVNDSGKKVPAGTAVLLKGTENSKNEKSYINYTYNDVESEAITTTNYLHGTVDSNVTTYATELGESEETAADYYFYLLCHNSASEEGSLGFYWNAKGGGPFTATRDKIWLALPKEMFETSDDVEVKITFGGFLAGEDEDTALDESIESFDGDESTENLDGDESTTGISSLSADATDAVIYNMAGLRVNDMSRPGIYIVGGKKVIKR